MISFGEIRFSGLSANMRLSKYLMSVSTVIPISIQKLCFTSKGLVFQVMFQVRNHFYLSFDDLFKNSMAI